MPPRREEPIKVADVVATVVTEVSSSVVTEVTTETPSEVVAETPSEVEMPSEEETLEEPSDVGLLFENAPEVLNEKDFKLKYPHTAKLFLLKKSELVAMALEKEIIVSELNTKVDIIARIEGVV